MQGAIRASSSRSQRQSQPRLMHICLSDKAVLQQARAVACMKGISLSEYVESALLVTLENWAKAVAQPREPLFDYTKRAVMHISLANASTLPQIRKLAEKRNVPLSRFVECVIRAEVDREWTPMMIHNYVPLLTSKN